MLRPSRPHKVHTHDYVGMYSYLSHEHAGLDGDGAALLLRRVAGESAGVAQCHQRGQGTILLEARPYRCFAVVQSQMQCAAALPQSTTVKCVKHELAFATISQFCVTSFYTVSPLSRQWNLYINALLVQML